MTSIDVFNQNSEDESMFNELNNVKEVDEKSSIGSDEEDEDCPSERISTPSKQSFHGDEERWSAEHRERITKKTQSERNMMFN